MVGLKLVKEPRVRLRSAYSRGFLVRNLVLASGFTLSMALACGDSDEPGGKHNVAGRAGSAGSEAGADSGGEGGEGAAAGRETGGESGQAGGGESGQSGGESGHGGEAPIGGQGGEHGGQGGQTGGEGGQVGGEAGATAGRGNGGTNGSGASGGTSGSSGTGASGGTSGSSGTSGGGTSGSSGTSGAGTGGSTAAGEGGAAGEGEAGAPAATPVCGNGVVEAGELCDTSIASGAGACPTSCNDGAACTTDVLSGSACQAHCTNTEIASPVAGDGCCPVGASFESDSDCPGPECGDGVAEGEEDCDDGDTVADAVCGSDCRFSCGNGVVEGGLGELCDTSIASGPGACPTSCNDGRVCTTDTLSGAACQAHCTNTEIVSLAPGDGCCPDIPNANANTDGDCRPVCGNNAVEAGEDCDDGDAVADAVCGATCRFSCGNGVLEAGLGELCDTSIASGPGACPTSCNDGKVCTTDTLSGSACQARCTNIDIVAPAAGDGCCPNGASSNTDDDCPIDCGNGILEATEDCDDGDTVADPVCGSTCQFTCGNGVVETALGEQCDTSIASGPGACPTSCNDGDVCTTDTLSGSACQAQCSHPRIVALVDGDGCCPGANSNNDDADCPVVCGNGAVEAGEDCDDGNTVADGVCGSNCRFSCGNGVVEVGLGEQCDTSIASGPGACPTSCNDGDACTTDTLSGSACQAQCSHGPVLVSAADGCCPTGANANTDGDCVPECGNGALEAGEACDDGNEVADPVCGSNCQLSCGNGVVEGAFGEVCDTSIASGPGACPTSCSDADACTTDTLSGSGCQAECTHLPVLVTAADGCCPDGANANTDQDCVPDCGNGALEAGEACDDGDQIADPVCGATCQFSCGNGVFEPGLLEECDPAIAFGPGACPVSCNDGSSCTTDTLTGSGCQTHCESTPIVVPQHEDGCCPEGVGANANNDDDCDPVCGNDELEAGEACDDGDVIADPVCGATCQFSCGNGVFEPGLQERCDPAIASGPGACPVSCNDGDACTTDTLIADGCQTRCEATEVVLPQHEDGCCPEGVGANANNDDDCDSICPNGVVEPGEECDDDNSVDTDDCTSLCEVAPRAFKFSDLDLRDPHTFVNASILGCRDVTDTPVPFTTFTTNGALQSNIQTDPNGDGLLDLAPTLVFREFDQAAATQPLELHFANCSAPAASTVCHPGSGSAITATATNMTAGQCLTALPGTVRPYATAVTSPNAPCFVTDSVTVTLNLLGIPLIFRDARVAATYSGNPATSLTSGLLVGFLSEADADTAIIPTSVVPAPIGGRPLSYLLPGGSLAGNVNCQAVSDKDVNNGVTGWWFYFNFPATRVPWSD